MDREETLGLVNAVDARLDSLVSKLDEEKESLGNAVKDMVQDHLAEFGIDHPSRPPSSAQRRGCREDEYLLARRSLLVWPLEEASTLGLQDFARKFMKLSDQELAGFQVTIVREFNRLPNLPDRREFSVEFSTYQDRDIFRFYAPRLAPHGRDAGLRLQLPDYLLSTFKLLENEAYRLVQRRPGTRRNIKFDDAHRSLVLDVKLPNMSWVRITADQVNKARRGRRQDKTPNVDEILAISGQALPDAPLESWDEEMQENPQNPQNNQNRQN